METHTPTSTLGKQLLGGAMGMVIAGGIYFVASTMSTGSLGALLVDTPTISDNAHRVSVNDKTITEGELRLIATRARQVAALQGQETERVLAEEQPEPTTITTRTETRLAERMRRFNEDGTPVVTTVQKNDVMHGGAPRLEEEVAVPVVADVSMTPSKTLPSSGLGTNVLVVIALLGSVLALRKKIVSQA